MKDIPGYEGKYKVSRDGRVWSEVSQRFRKLTTDKDGYKVIWLQKKKHRVHRLVAEAYIGSIEGQEINHLNSVRDDNRVENLEILSRIEHVIKDYGYKKPYCELPTSCKLGWKMIKYVPKHKEVIGVQCGEVAEMWATTKEIADTLSVPHVRVKNVVDKKAKTFYDRTRHIWRLI